jgi:cytochrome b
LIRHHEDRDETVDDLKRPMQIWDAPTRLFHWAIVVLFCTAWLTERLNWMELHLLNGYTVLALLLFRLAWGIVGSDTARFSRFLKSPLAALHHLSRLNHREPDTEIGHNAAGGWMVLLMLVLLAIQVGTGLCANDDANTEGPLVKYVGKDWSDWLSHIHSVNFTLIQIAIVLHIAAIAAYAAMKRHDLVRPMITGRKLLPGGLPTPVMASSLLALMLFAIAAGTVGFLASWL